MPGGVPGYRSRGPRGRTLSARGVTWYPRGAWCTLGRGPGSQFPRPPVHALHRPPAVLHPHPSAPGTPSCQASEDGPGGIFQALEHFEFVEHAEPRPAGVAVRRAVVGMTTAAAELFCGIAPQPPTDTVARLGEVRGRADWDGGAPEDP